jgi:hypothetical protein
MVDQLSHLLQKLPVAREVGTEGNLGVGGSEGSCWHLKDLTDNVNFGRQPSPTKFRHRARCDRCGQWQPSNANSS